MREAKSALTVIDAYNYLRDEIKREDEITHQRLIVALTFQGFLITATTFLLSNQWTFDSSAMIGPNRFYLELATIRIAVLYGIGTAGISVGFGTAAGIHAARISISKTLEWWNEKIGAMAGDDRALIPPAFELGKHGRSHWLGGASAFIIAYAFPILWVAYLVMLTCRGFGWR